MKTTAVLLLANMLALLLVGMMASRGLLPLSPKALEASRGTAAPAWITGRRNAPEAAAPVAIGDRHEAAAPGAAEMAMPVRWTAPLLDQMLSPTEKAEALAPDLQDAMGRMEPIYDPTRLDGPVAPDMHVSPGTASLFDVFGERWRLATDDPNVNLKSRTVGLAWQAAALPPCDAYTRRRSHEFGEAALTAMARADCVRLRRWERDDAAPVPVVAAPLDLPLFAAPLPGSRMSSQAFWAAQGNRIAGIQAHLRRRWQAGARPPVQLGSSR